MSEPSKAEIAIAAIKARLYHRAEIMETRDEIQIKTWGDQARARGWYDGGARQVLRPYVIDLDALTPAAQLVVALAAHSSFFLVGIVFPTMIEFGLIL